MYERITLFILIFIITGISCHNQYPSIEANVGALKEMKVQEPSADSTSGIHFTLASNYFVKNTVKKIDHPKIEDAAKFESYFGMATVMGVNGKPTSIDFSKQYVIALVEPETDINTKITPMKLTKTNVEELTLFYKIEKGEKMTYTMRPMSILIVDKTYSAAKILLKAID